MGVGYFDAEFATKPRSIYLKYKSRNAINTAYTFHLWGIVRFTFYNAGNLHRFRLNPNEN